VKFELISRIAKGDARCELRLVKVEEEEEEEEDAGR